MNQYKDDVSIEVILSPEAYARLEKMRDENKLKYGSITLYLSEYINYLVLAGVSYNCDSNVLQLPKYKNK